MKFGKMFKRVVDSGTPANTTLGTDVIDVLKSHTDQAASVKDKETGCIYETRTQNINGFPAQRLVVGYMPPVGGTPIDLAATMYLLDDTSGFWYIVASIDALKKGGLTYFDTPTITDNPNTTSGTGSAGSMRVMLIVSEPSGQTANDGEHIFIIGTDVSNPGL